MSQTPYLLIDELNENQAQKSVTVNDALVALDKAVAGVLSKAITVADVTLTDDEARNAIISLTGTLTANRALIVPARTKIYAIKNGTSGSFTVTVKTSGGSGVVVTQGVTALVICDGTNVTGLAGYLTVEEADASPSVKTVNKIKVTNAALSDDGSGVVSIATGGSPGSGTNNIEIGAYGSRPAAGNDGAVYVSNDSAILSIDDGVNWKHFARLIPNLEMNAQVSDFTWVNQGAATATDTGGAIRVEIAHFGTSVRILAKTAPSTPYTVTVAILPPSHITPSLRAMRTGIGWRDSASSKLTYVVVGSDGGILRARVVTFTNETTALANVGVPMDLQPWFGLVWVRIEDDGTNRKAYVSATGFSGDWIQIYSVTRTTHLTPNQIALMFDANWETAQTDGFAPKNISYYYHYDEA